MSLFLRIFWAGKIGGDCPAPLYLRPCDPLIAAQSFDVTPSEMAINNHFYEVIFPSNSARFAYANSRVLHRNCEKYRSFHQRMVE